MLRLILLLAVAVECRAELDVRWRSVRCPYQSNDVWLAGSCYRVFRPDDILRLNNKDAAGLCSESGGGIADLTLDDIAVQLFLIQEQLVLQSNQQVYIWNGNSESRDENCTAWLLKPGLLPQLSDIDCSVKTGWVCKYAPTHCEHPTAVPSVVRFRQNSTRYQIGHILNYTCHDSLHSIRCLKGGFWSAMDVRSCRSGVRHRDVTCALPPTIANGNYTLLQGHTREGARVLYSCIPGYALDGTFQTFQLLCLPSGMWSGTIPTCKKSVACPPLNIAHGRVEYGSNGEAVVLCDKGYQLSGRAQLECLYYGVWSGEIPLCLSSGLLFGNGDPRLSDVATPEGEQTGGVNSGAAVAISSVVLVVLLLAFGGLYVYIKRQKNTVKIVPQTQSAGTTTIISAPIRQQISPKQTAQVKPMKHEGTLTVKAQPAIVQPASMSKNQRPRSRQSTADSLNKQQRIFLSDVMRSPSATGGLDKLSQASTKQIPITSKVARLKQVFESEDEDGDQPVIGRYRKNDQSFNKFGRRTYQFKVPPGSESDTEAVIASASLSRPPQPAQRLVRQQSFDQDSPPHTPPQRSASTEQVSAQREPVYASLSHANPPSNRPPVPSERPKVPKAPQARIPVRTFDRPPTAADVSPVRTLDRYPEPLQRIHDPLELPPVPSRVREYPPDLSPNRKLDRPKDPGLPHFYFATEPRPPPPGPRYYDDTQQDQFTLPRVARARQSWAATGPSFAPIDRTKSQESIENFVRLHQGPTRPPRTRSRSPPRENYFYQPHVDHLPLRVKFSDAVTTYTVSGDAKSRKPPKPSAEVRMQKEAQRQNAAKGRGAKGARSGTANQTRLIPADRMMA